jgi:hypothetical protein
LFYTLPSTLWQSKKEAAAASAQRKAARTLRKKERREAKKKKAQAHRTTETADLSHRPKATAARPHQHHGTNAPASQHAGMGGHPVDGYLAYASVVNMKVGGALGDEGSIVVQSTVAVAKNATSVSIGLLKLDRHAHLNVLAYLKPNWVQWGGNGLGGREREREKKKQRERRMVSVGPPHLFFFRLKTTNHLFSFGHLL